MKKYVFIFLLFISYSFVSAQCISGPLRECYNCSKIKAIKEKHFLLRVPFSKIEPSEEYYENGYLSRINNSMLNYDFSDSSLTVVKRMLENGNLSKDAITTLYYFKENKYYEYKSYHTSTFENKLSVIGSNFIYKDSLLMSYENNLYRADTIYLRVKIENEYNVKKQLIKACVIRIYKNPAESAIISIYAPKTDSTTHIFSYNEQGYLTDYIVESSNKKNSYYSVVPYSANERYKYHIHYSKLDKHGNWTKSYFITSKGKKFRSTRIIEYWEDK